MAQLVLKTSFQGDLRRMTFDSVDQVSFQEISDFIAKSYDLDDFVAKYQDEEGDWCTLTLATLTDAMQLAQDKQRLLRLEVLNGGSHSPLPTMKMASQRSLSECSWEMLDFDDEDADMDVMDALEEGSVPSSIEVTSNAGPAESHHFPEEIEESEGADSEDCFLVASQAPASVAETSLGEDGFLLEPADLPATAPPASAEDALEVDAIEVEAMEEAPRLPENDMAAEPELSSEEKINFILAAFDKNGDGRLNFEECLDLLVWASGELMPFEVFQMTCDELHVDSQQGFGPRELTTLYDCFGTQERDFQAAVRKLTHEPAAPAPAPGANVPHAGPGPCRGRLSPWMALPLLPICPVAAGAVALAATLRNRKCQ